MSFLASLTMFVLEKVFVSMFSKNKNLKLNYILDYIILKKCLFSNFNFMGVQSKFFKQGKNYVVPGIIGI